MGKRGKQYIPNEYYIDGNNAIFSIYDKYGNKSCEFIIDKEDIDKISQYRWGDRGRHRICKGSGNERSFLHRFVLGISKDDPCMVDHIDGNPLNNKKNNLRITNRDGNAKNRKVCARNKTGFNGVSYIKGRDKYKVGIHYLSETLFFGEYKELCDAVYARYVAETMLYKEYRSTQNDEQVIYMIEQCENKEEIKEYVESRIKQYI